MFAGKMSFALYRTTPISTAAPEDVAPVAAALSEDKTLRERWQEKKRQVPQLQKELLTGICAVC